MLETATEHIPLYVVEWILRNLQAQGIFDVISGILIGRHPVKEQIEEYKNCYTKVIVDECGKDLPIVYNLNFGHAEPIGVFPLGLEYEIDCDCKTVTLLEPATK